MHQIKNNPYRTVGLLVGATAREQERQIKRLKQFIEADQEPQDDFSFPALGRVHRTIDNVNDAASKLNLDKDKINAALFWFYNGNAITDEPAFDALKSEQLDKAISIWEKLTESKEISKRNASAYFNLSTILLNKAFVNTANETYFYPLFVRGFELKLKFIESEFIIEFKKLATDETFKTTKKDLQLLFLSQIQSEIEKQGGLTENKFLDLLTKQEFSAKEEFLKQFVQKPIDQIEKKIEETKSNREAIKANALKYGQKLFSETKENLAQIKSILGASDFNFSAISDKLALEIFLCGRDYFMHYRDTNFDPSSDAMIMFKQAKSISLGNITIQRIDSNINDLQDWINEKPDRDRQKLISGDIEFITTKLDKFQSQPDTVSIAKELVDSCKPRLLNIKNSLGARDDFYLKISSAIVRNALGMLVTAVNEAQDRFSANKNIVSLKNIIEEASRVTSSLESMDMIPDLRTQFSKNKQSLSGLVSQVNTISYNNTKKGNCYIATMAYGDYNHPQVFILRQFRDNVLEKYFLGRVFIKGYYYFSPFLVEKLKNKKGINNFIRKTLNQLIKLIKK